MPKNEDIIVPSEVVVAISTNRVQFIDMLAQRLKGGGGLPREEQQGMVKLLREMVDERDKIHQRLQLLERRVNEAYSAAKGQVTAMIKLSEILGSDRDDNEDADI